MHVQQQTIQDGPVPQSVVPGSLTVYRPPLSEGWSLVAEFPGGENGPTRFINIAYPALIMNDNDDNNISSAIGSTTRCLLNHLYQESGMPRTAHISSHVS